MKRIERRKKARSAAVKKFIELQQQKKLMEDGEDDKPDTPQDYAQTIVATCDSPFSSQEMPFISEGRFFNSEQKMSARDRFIGEEDEEREEGEEREKKGNNYPSNLAAQESEGSLPKIDTPSNVFEISKEENQALLEKCRAELFNYTNGDSEMPITTNNEIQPMLMWEDQVLTAGDLEQ